MRVWRLAILSLSATATLFGCAPAGAQETMERGLFNGAGACAAQACHGGGDPQRQEYKIWANRDRDRHSLAFASLSGEVGHRIGERLGIDPPNAPECLGCHAAVPERFGKSFDRADGVSCELCHGASGHWLGSHAAPDFKKLSPMQKEDEGLRDLTTPAKRAAVCVDCHVGGEGRDVTHEMMAAGHPPLAFSLPRFLHDMPPHWKKPDPPGDLDAWAAGAKAVVVARLRQVARMARRDTVWPEFAAFDCYACHHEIGLGADALPGARPGDLPLELASLDVLAAGDPAIAKRLEGILGMTFRPGGERRRLADAVERAASDVEDLPAPKAEGFREGVDAWLARVEAGETRAGYAAMQQAKLLAFALAADPASPAFVGAYDALDAALAKPYDERACAALARKALAAR